MHRHLTPDEIERCALGEEDRPGPLSSHLRDCAACRREVARLEALHELLSILPDLEPAPGFAARVMTRVRLPEPWYERARAGLRERWAVLAAGLAAATATVGGMAYWLFGRQELTPTGLLAFLLESARTLAVRAAIGGGRWLYDLGVIDLVSGLTESIALTEAAAGMALLSLLSCGALWSMRRLARTESVRLPRPAGG